MRTRHHDVPVQGQPRPIRSIIIPVAALILLLGACSSGNESPLEGQYLNEETELLIVFGSALGDNWATVAMKNMGRYQQVIGKRWEYDVASREGSSFTLVCTDGDLGDLDVGDKVLVTMAGDSIHVRTPEGGSIYDGEFRLVHPEFDVKFGL